MICLGYTCEHHLGTKSTEEWCFGTMFLNASRCGLMFLNAGIKRFMFWNAVFIHIFKRLTFWNVDLKPLTFQNIIRSRQ